MLKGASRVYGEAVALAPLDLSVAKGETVALIGPSGCGKSTLIRLVAGLVDPSAGSVEVLGERVTPGSVTALRRRMGYVIQEGGLFPHLSARANVELMGRHVGRTVDLKGLADLVRLDATLLDRPPGELSGGQRQRVGIMRALALLPEILLLDEPMGALDPLVRRGLQDDLRRIFSETGVTVILVTHDLSEAAYLAGRVVLLDKGLVVQDGPYRDLLEKPATPFAAEFVAAQRSPIAL